MILATFIYGIIRFASLLVLKFMASVCVRVETGGEGCRSYFKRADYEACGDVQRQGIRLLQGRLDAWLDTGDVLLD